MWIFIWGCNTWRECRGGDSFCSTTFEDTGSRTFGFWSSKMEYFPEGSNHSIEQVVVAMLLPVGICFWHGCYINAIKVHEITERLENCSMRGKFEAVYICEYNSWWWRLYISDRIFKEKIISIVVIIRI